MAEKRMGGQSIRFRNPPIIVGNASIVGKKEGEGPLGRYFDQVLEDDLWDEKTFEKAERKMFTQAIKMAITKSGIAESDIHVILGGDLLNQIITASFAAVTFSNPFLGLYGACSTMAESLAVGSCLIDGGFVDQVVCATASHFSTAERQYRTPLELGNQRPPTAQWTVTGSGASVLAAQGSGPRVMGVTLGKAIDMGIKDANNMGAAMAPAAADTLIAHFRDWQVEPDYYDLIITGDLGILGRAITADLCAKEGFAIESKYTDCGCEIYGPEQDTHMGGSGCGCSASVLNGMLMHRLLEGDLKRLLFVPTGAFLSPTSSMQGENIAGIAYAISIEG